MIAVRRYCSKRASVCLSSRDMFDRSENRCPLPADQTRSEAPPISFSSTSCGGGIFSACIKRAMKVASCIASSRSAVACATGSLDQMLAISRWFRWEEPGYSLRLIVTKRRSCVAAYGNIRLKVPKGVFHLAPAIDSQRKKLTTMKYKSMHDEYRTVVCIEVGCPRVFLIKNSTFGIDWDSGHLL
jgi:hypothetical protein